MAKQVVNLGTSANKGDGDPLRTAFTKVNSNFTELYSSLASQAGSITSDVTGSVFGDDSTLLVDGVNNTIPGYTNTADLKALVAASTSFADYQTRIAAL